MNRYIFTSESVTEGHPDKICDQVSDAILDAILEKDNNARVACETSITTGLVLVMGEITTTSYIDINKIVRNTIREIGYDSSDKGFDANSCGVMLSIDEQSPDISLGTNDDIGGAGDQGLMFGYATDETPEMMPLPIVLSHKLTKRLAEVRKNNTLGYLRPDGKAQVSVEYIDGKASRIECVVVSSQHSDKVDIETLRKDIRTNVIDAIIPENMIDENTKFYINPTGRFVVGGPMGDSGLTGRKIIVDTYGGFSRHGGGAFSGKDPTKVDRCAAYMARYIAKNLVASSIASKVEIGLSYAIGISKPVSLLVDTFGTSKYTNDEIIQLVNSNFDMTPQGIIKTLDLRRPIYNQVASYGHFGRNDLDLPWEKTDKLLKL